MYRKRYGQAVDSLDMPRFLAGNAKPSPAAIIPRQKSLPLTARFATWLVFWAMTVLAPCCDRFGLGWPEGQAVFSAAPAHEDGAGHEEGSNPLHSLCHTIGSFDTVAPPQAVFGLG